VPPETIVINEWLLHDMRGDNGPDAQKQTQAFLEAFRSGPNRIVVLRESKWDNKAWALWTEQDARVQVLSKLLYLGVLIDPLKCSHLNPDQVQLLPPGLAEQVPPDDAYLFQTALAAGARTIVTTDGRLIAAVPAATQYEIRLITRDDYYQELGL
jgi:hypothetical protein